MSQLPNVLHMGEVFQKTGILNTKLGRNFSAISEDKLYLYKSKYDSRPSSQVNLLGCDVTFSDRDGRFQNVVKILQDGNEKCWFSTSTKKTAGIWVQVSVIKHKVNNKIEKKCDQNMIK